MRIFHSHCSNRVQQSVHVACPLHDIAAMWASPAPLPCRKPVLTCTCRPVSETSQTGMAVTASGVRRQVLVVLGATDGSSRTVNVAEPIQSSARRSHCRRGPHAREQAMENLAMATAAGLVALRPGNWLIGGRISQATAGLMLESTWQADPSGRNSWQ